MATARACLPALPCSQRRAFLPRVLVALAVTLPLWRTLRGRHAFEMPRPRVGAPWAWQRVLEPWERLAPCAASALSCPVSALPSCGRAPPGRDGAVLRAHTTGPSWSCPTWAPPARAGAVRRAHYRAELELSDVRAPPGTSWGRPPWAPLGRAGRGDDGCRPGTRPGPSWSCPTSASTTGPSWSRPTGARLGEEPNSIAAPPGLD
jgi:hypothetical protein